jgi:type VI secretion system protein VasI
MLRAIFVAAAAATLADPAFAATDVTPFLECSAIEDSVARLACFDAAVAPVKEAANEAAAAELAPTNPGEWLTEVETSPIDDSTNVYSIVLAKEAYEGTYATHRPALIIRCVENTTSLVLNFDGDYMSDLAQRGRVTTRVDDRPAVEKSMVESTSNEALGLWGGGSSIPFIKTMLGGEIFLVRAIPVNSNPVTVEFNIAGIDEAVRPVREACGW